ncbi:glycoside hydrolase family 3 protein [Rheinheimera riviphila]|uniref:glycoside hydrolase family 3 protein n=1 Tax=Rheinheimera riviphila TaxID=1834037 RepID=UPI001981E1CA|nr:glycoside hydrolase family 3 N-terminal domain-containing protein [Rheinheimera riviphila]
MYNTQMIQMQHRISQLVASLPLPQKVGQLFMLAFAGQDLAYAKTLVADFHIGGFYLTDDNAPNPAAARVLASELQHTAALRACDAPLILGVDQEGAWGVLTQHTDLGPGNLALGVTDDLALTAQMYQVYARQMLPLGYNTILAPCADVNSNPDNPIIGQRSFGDSPELVSRHVATAVQALMQAGSLSCAKHFPGHGDTATDSHSGLPRVELDKKELLESHLQPFVAAIAAGVPLIMTSHILYPALDTEYPATLSPAILTDLLRHELGFDGVILTDSMNMGAMRQFYTPVAAAVQALKAGADMIMLSEEHYENERTDYKKLQAQTIVGVIEAVRQGELAEAVIDQALQRVLRLRYQLSQQLPEQTAVAPGQSAQVFVQASAQVAAHAAQSALRLKRNSAGVFPLQHQKQSLLLAFAADPAGYDKICNSRGIGPNDPIPASSVLRAELERSPLSVEFWSYLTLQQQLAAGAPLPEGQLLVLVTEDYPLPGDQLDLAAQQQKVQQALALWRQQVMVLALRSDTELAAYPELATYLCSYSSRRCSAIAAAKALIDGHL